MDEKQLDIKVETEDLVPKYANLMQVSHQHEEFMLDFFHVAPPHGVLNGRLIVSPGHVKRMIKALEENLERYEDRYGDVQETPHPSKSPSVGYGDLERSQQQLKDQVGQLQDQKIAYEMIVSAQNLLEKADGDAHTDAIDAVKEAIDDLRSAIDAGEKLKAAKASLKKAADALGEKIHQSE